MSTALPLLRKLGKSSWTTPIIAMGFDGSVDIHSHVGGLKGSNVLRVTQPLCVC